MNMINYNVAQNSSQNGRNMIMTAVPLVKPLQVQDMLCLYQ